MRIRGGAGQNWTYIVVNVNDVMLQYRTSSTESGGSASRVHPVPLHPLNKTKSRHGNLMSLHPELQHVSKPRDVQAGI